MLRADRNIDVYRGTLEKVERDLSSISLISARSPSICPRAPYRAKLVSDLSTFPHLPSIPTGIPHLTSISSHLPRSQLASFISPRSPLISLDPNWHPSSHLDLLSSPHSPLDPLASGGALPDAPRGEPRASQAHPRALPHEQPGRDRRHRPHPHAGAWPTIPPRWPPDDFPVDEADRVDEANCTWARGLPTRLM